MPQWCGGKDLNILIEGTSSDAASSREARAFDSGQTGSPQLVVSYDDTTATGCISGESVYQVSRSNDNIEENNNGYENTGSELTFSSNYNSYIGVRFQNVNIPQGAEITEAYIELTAYSSYNQNNSSMLIRGVAANDADDFSSGNRYLLRNIAVSYTHLTLPTTPYV